LTVLDRPAEFAVMMWRDGTAADEEFVTLARALVIAVPTGAAPTGAAPTGAAPR
jgi:hypothetical protein